MEKPSAPEARRQAAQTVWVPMTLARAEHSLRRLQRALRNNRSVDYCHKLWSRVIRGRDDDSCVVCGSLDRVEAHHIVRKTFFPGLRFETGNGITLCAKCHRTAHRGFNGRPDMSLPMDAQGGERIELITHLLGHLVSAERRHHLVADDYYYIMSAIVRSASSGNSRAFHGSLRYPVLDWSRLGESGVKLPARH